MAAFITTCAVCSSEIEAQRSTRKTCSNACRANLRRLDHERFLADTAQLLRDQTATIIAGSDPVVMAALERRARQLLG